MPAPPGITNAALISSRSSRCSGTGTWAPRCVTSPRRRRSLRTRTAVRSLAPWPGWKERVMQIKWQLRLAAAHREVWTGAQLRRLLAERSGLQLSSASVSALLTKQPAQVKLDTLAALCTALECTPNDLFEVDTTPAEHAAAPAPARAEP